MTVPFIDKITDLVFNNYFGYITLNDASTIASIIAPFELHDHYSLKTAFENENNRSLIANARNSLLSFFEEYVEDYSEFDLSDIEHVIYFNRDIDEWELEEYEYSFDKIRYVLLLVAFINCFQKMNPNSNLRPNNISKLEDIATYKAGSFIFYRGQSNEEWRILPSALRNEKTNCLFNLDYYLKRVEQYNLKEKYDKYIKATTDEPIYYKCAFLQHACSFSPLIDFSKDSIVAASFSLSNKSSFNDYNNISSSIYVCYFEEEKPGVKIIREINQINDFLKKDFFIFNISENHICFGKSITLENSNKIIEFCSLEEIIDKLMPRVCFIDLPTNDRMKYQKGLFLCFYGCINLGGRIFYELAPYFNMAKLIISPNKKDGFRNEIRIKKPEYDSNHILDPYLIFYE